MGGWLATLSTLSGSAPVQADNEGKFLSSSKRESLFITDGFTNWKEATCSFRSHKQSKSHLEAVEAIITAPMQSADIGELLNREHLEQKKTNRAIFIQILETSDLFSQVLLLHGTYSFNSSQSLSTMRRIKGSFAEYQD